MRSKTIDGLRGVGLLMVAINHSFLVFLADGRDGIWASKYWDDLTLSQRVIQVILTIGNGNLAVMMFLVISGLVTGLAYERHRVTGRPLSQFWLRRVVRLYPLYILVMIVSLLIARMLGNPTENAPWTSWYLRYLTQPNLAGLLNNIFLIRTDFSGATWTLKAELWFYLTFIPLYYLSRIGRVWTDVVIMLIILTGASLIPRIEPSLLVIFYIGLCLPKYESLFVRLAQNKLGNTVVPILIVIAAIASYVGLSGVRLWLIQGLIVGLVIGMLWSTKDAWGRWLVNKYWQRLGRISYGFYLWHFIVLYSLARVAVYIVGSAWIGQHSIMTGFGLAAISIIIAYFLARFTYQLIERPREAKLLSQRVTALSMMT